MTFIVLYLDDQEVETLETFDTYVDALEYADHLDPLYSSIKVAEVKYERTATATPQDLPAMRG